MKGAYLDCPRLDRITFDPAVCGGQACVRGLRIPVATVLRHLAAGQTPDEVVGDLPDLERDDVLACLRYAAWLATERTTDLPPAA